MRQRLQKILSERGVASRRTAERLIADGAVTVNGTVAALGQSADPEADRITVSGRPLPEKTSTVYLMLHKPRGYVTTLSDELGRPNVAELVRDCGCRVYPVGRLDYASEGLLLLTNDGAFANRLMHPRGEVAKVYEVTVSGDLTDAAARLARPIVLDGYQIRTPLVRLLRQSAEKATFEITIFEGRNRQIRRMCEAAGLRVRRLCRTREGSLSLGTLPAGKWRYLTAQELEQIKKEEVK